MVEGNRGIRGVGGKTTKVRQRKSLMMEMENMQELLRRL